MAVQAVRPTPVAPALWRLALLLTSKGLRSACDRVSSSSWRRLERFDGRESTCWDMAARLVRGAGRRRRHRLSLWPGCRGFYHLHRRRTHGGAIWGREPRSPRCLGLAGRRRCGDRGGGVRLLCVLWHLRVPRRHRGASRGVEPDAELDEQGAGASRRTGGRYHHPLDTAGANWWATAGGQPRLAAL